MSLRSGVRIDALSEHKETVIQEFQNEVDKRWEELKFKCSRD